MLRNLSNLICQSLEFVTTLTFAKLDDDDDDDDDNALFLWYG